MLYQLLLFLLLGVLTGCFFLARTGLVVITVSGQSMAPTFQHGDRLLIARRWLTRHPGKGQVVVVKLDEQFPDATPNLRENYYIKRVVALAGETYTSQLSINAFSQHLPAQRNTQPEDVQTWSIPRNHIFVCGDNARKSIDSRTWGPLPLSNVLGKVLLRLSPGISAVAAGKKNARLSDRNGGK